MQNGKGSKSRISDIKTYKDNYSQINWDKNMSKPVSNYEKLLKSHEFKKCEGVAEPKISAKPVLKPSSLKLKNDSFFSCKEEKCGFCGKDILSWEKRYLVNGRVECGDCGVDGIELYFLDN